MSTKGQSTPVSLVWQPAPSQVKTLEKVAADRAPIASTRSPTFRRLTHRHCQAEAPLTEQDCQR